jgi:hypothetical protein
VYDRARTVLVNEPTFDWNELRLEQDEKGEGNLDRRPIPSECLFNLRNEGGWYILRDQENYFFSITYLILKH